jgi:hypothetical protein
MKPVGYQQITAPSTNTALTVPSGASCALIQAELQNIRWRDDGTAPTTAVGMQIAAGDSMLYVGDLATIQVIQEASTGKVNITYYATP